MSKRIQFTVEIRFSESNHLVKRLGVFDDPESAETTAQEFMRTSPDRDFIESQILEIEVE